MAGLTTMKGARLEFVVRKIDGKIKLPVHSFNPKTKKIEATAREVDAGYIVYMPSGHSYRLSKSQLVKKGFDRQPKIMNLDKVNDTDTPAGRFKHAIDMDARKKAWEDLENDVIKSCVRRHGPVINKETENVAEAA